VASYKPVLAAVKFIHEHNFPCETKITEMTAAIKILDDLEQE
jgi:hypothetical protein